MPYPKKVLCVDDNADTAESTGLLLELAGFDVRVCQDGSSALSTAAEFEPDVCVIDLLMPGMSGEELACRLRAQNPEHPPRCIAMTGLWDIDAQHQTHNVGFEAHLVKPVAPDRLIQTIHGDAVLSAAAH